MITGEKKFEYRMPSHWLFSRIEMKWYDAIKFVNGYGKNKPYFIAEYKGWQHLKEPEFLNYSNGLSFFVDEGTVCIKLGKIIEIGNL